MKQILMFALFVALMLLFFWAISGQRAAYIPEDAAHEVKAERLCLDCHAPGKEAPLSKEHPPKEQCFECHKRKKDTR